MNPEEEELEERLDIISKVSKLPESRKICEELMKLREIIGISAPLLPNTAFAIAAGFIMKRFSAEDSIEMANSTINFYNLFFKGIDRLD